MTLQEPSASPSSSESSPADLAPAARSSESGPAIAPELERCLAGKRALICEDEGVIQMQVSRALKLAGVEVIGSAVNGKEGVDLALSERPDIVLMDLNIPKIDGMEAARRIIAAYHPCVVMLTAYGDHDLRKRAKEIGVCGYVTKPISSDTLIPSLEEAFSAFCDGKQGRLFS